jgi:hypothetical protein
MTANVRFKARVASCATAALLGLLAVSSPLSAQWAQRPDPKAPHTKDGKVNLSGPAPRQANGNPDLSGMWVVADAHLQFNMAADTPGVELTPAYAAIYKDHLDQQGKDRPSGHCLPHSIPDAMLAPTPFKFIHTPGETLILFEEFVDFRQIFTDGRELPKNPEGAWFGYSVGRWENGAFVVDTRGFNDKSWLDDDGHPHSDALHTIERFRRPDYGHLVMEITIDDPKAYVKPWSTTVHFNLLPQMELIEGVCDNNYDVPHLVGK